MRALLLLLLLAPRDGALVLVSNGATTYEIVSAHPLAARELATFLEKSTGVRFATVAVATPGKDHLFVGGKAEGLRPEGFRIHAVGRDLFLVGDDGPGDPEQVKRNRPTRCGTLFAVYEFLERFVGVTFAWHDELGTVVPPRRELRVPLPLDLVQAPDWATRTIINSPEGETGKLFGRRLRLGSSFETDYTHNWFRICPLEKYGAAHPEYFALVRGQRKTQASGKNHGAQVCTTNPDVIELFAKAAIDHFAANPADEVFAVSPNDGKGFCECGPCRALDGPWEGDQPNLSDRILTFYNGIAERLVRVHPTKRLGGFVYASYQHAPSRVKPHAALSLAHATNSAHAQGMGGAREVEDERAWTSLAREVTKYDIYYYGDYGSMNLPAPVTVHLTEKLRREHELGFRGAYLYAAPSYELLGAGQYLMARLMWDRKADVEALEKRFYDALYGLAGVDALEYYRLLESRLRKARLEGIERREPIVRRALGWVGSEADSPAYTIAAYAPILDEAAAILVRARGRSLSAPERERLARLQDHHDLLAGTVRAMLAAGRFEADLRADDLQAFRAALGLRESARARVRLYAPTLTRDLDGDDAGRLSLISPKGALARLEKVPVVGAPVRLTGMDAPATLVGGARVEVGGPSLKVTVPPGGEATVKLEAAVQPGGLYRLSMTKRCSGVRPAYDRTREAPVIRLQGSGRSSTLLGVPAFEDGTGISRFILQVPADVSTLKVTLAFPLPGAFRLDDLLLEPLE